MWKKTTPLPPGVNKFFLQGLLWAGMVGVLFSEASWANQWPIEPPPEAAYVDWENLSIGVSGKAPPHFLVSSVVQSRSSAERLARLNAAERLFFLVRELRLNSRLTLGECAPESSLKEGLAQLLLSRTPTAHWRFSDGGQSFFFHLPFSALSPLCPEFSKAIAQLPALSVDLSVDLSAEEIFAKQGEAKVLWVAPSQEEKTEPCLFPVLFSEDRSWVLDTAAEGYVVVWSAKAPAQTQQARPSKAATSKTAPSKAAPSKTHGTVPQHSVAWTVQAVQRAHCGFELGNEAAAKVKSKIHAKQLGQRIVVKIQGKGK